jgi:phosphatidylglycerol:prolipoprotein diacylglycerol transferase
LALPKVGFPGLGIGDFSVNSVIVRIGGFALNWYGLIIAAGFLLAVIYCLRRVGEFSLKQDEFIDMLLFAVPSAIIGARLYYCAFNWDDYKDDLVQILFIREGGLAIYGAVIASFLACGVFCWVRRIHAGAILDLAVLGLLIGQALGRWGNFFNVEVYGKETTLPWRMHVVSAWGTDRGNVHPLFFYEFLWTSLGFLLLHLLSRKRRFNGQLLLLYIAWYGLGRAALEGLRDTQYVLYIGSNIAVSQLLAAVSAIAALLLLGYNYVFKQHDPEDIGAWAVARAEFFAAKAAPEEAEETEETEEATEEPEETEETAEETQTEETDDDGSTA